MLRLLGLGCGLAGFLALTVALAADPTPPRTLMNSTGKLLFHDPMTTGLSQQWKVSHGTFEAKDGATRGVEVMSDMHAAVARLPLPMTDVVVQYSFKLDGAGSTTLSFNTTTQHLSRVWIRPTQLSVQKDDQDGKNKPDRAEVLDTKPISIKPGEWHTLVVELRGPHILATLDGTVTAYGSHPTIDKPKANVGITVKGEAVSFKNFTIWEGSPSKDWETNKAKLAK